MSEEKPLSATVFSEQQIHELQNEQKQIDTGISISDIWLNHINEETLNLTSVLLIIILKVNHKTLNYLRNLERDTI